MAVKNEWNYRGKNIELQSKLDLPTAEWFGAEVRRMMSESGKDTAERTGEYSAYNFGNGEYADGWTTKLTMKKSQYQAVVYNKSKKAPLGHLLENGHIIKNQYGIYGFVNGKPHLEPAYQWGKEQLEEGASRLLNKTIAKMR